MAPRIVLYSEPGKMQETTVSEPLFAAEKIRLRRHLGLGDELGDPPREPPALQPLFFVERTPESRGVCKLPGCTQTIEPDSLRFAVNPAMGSNNWFRSSSDFYHLQCFEKLADFSQADFLDRVQPLTRNTWELRGLKASSVLDGSYLVSGGVERLVLEWKVARRMAIDQRDGVYNEAMYLLQPSVEDLLYKAGSASYRPHGRPAGLDLYEYYHLARLLAPNESDGVGDVQEWNIFARYLYVPGSEAADDPHDLSAMLGRWERDVVIARGKTKLEGKAVRALRRLSIIPVPR